MKLRFIRNLSNTAIISLKKAKHPTGSSSGSFEKQFYKVAEAPRRDRPWKTPRYGGDKDTWFRKKYAHVHARQASRKGESKGRLGKYDSGDDDPYGKKEAHRDKIKRAKEAAREAKLKHRAGFKVKNFRSLVQDMDDRGSFGRGWANGLFDQQPLLEYIYGTNSVMAALMGNKRSKADLKLFYYGGGSGGNGLEVTSENSNGGSGESCDTVSKARNSDLRRVIQKAASLKIPVQTKTKHELSQLAGGNPHNNVVLVSRPLPPVEIVSLGPVDTASTKYTLNIEDDGDGDGDDSNDALVIDTTHHSKARLSTQDVTYKTRGDTKLFPLGVYLDEVQDPHNLGAIIRSCYFLGADFLVVPRRNSCRLSPVVAKASSGALEFLPIYHTDDPVRFFRESQIGAAEPSEPTQEVSTGDNDSSTSINYWTFVAADSAHGPAATAAASGPPGGGSKPIHIDDLHTLLAVTPVVLVLGNEGRGIRRALRHLADYSVAIPRRTEEAGESEAEFVKNDDDSNSNTVDSLNVSVAAGILLDRLLTP